MPQLIKKALSLIGKVLVVVILMYVSFSVGRGHIDEENLFEAVASFPCDEECQHKTGLPEGASISKKRTALECRYYYPSDVDNYRLQLYWVDDWKDLYEGAELHETQSGTQHSPPFYFEYGSYFQELDTISEFDLDRSPLFNTYLKKRPSGTCPTFLRPTYDVHIPPVSVGLDTVRDFQSSK